MPRRVRVVFHDPTVKDLRHLASAFHVQTSGGIIRGEEVMPPPAIGPNVEARGERGNTLAISLKKIDIEL